MSRKTQEILLDLEECKDNFDVDDAERLSAELQERMEDAVKKTGNNLGLMINKYGEVWYMEGRRDGIMSQTIKGGVGAGGIMLMALGFLAGVVVSWILI